MNAISDTLENLDNVDYEKEVYKAGDVLITSRTDLDDTWTLANGEPITKENDLFDIQYKSWVPGLVFNKKSTSMQFPGSSDGFYDGENVYIPYFSSNTMMVQKRKPDGSSENTVINDISSYYITPVQYKYGSIKYINGLAMFTYASSKSGTMNIYLAYSSDFNSWTNKLLFSLNAMTFYGCSIQYINNEYVFVASTYVSGDGYGKYLTIAHGSLTNISSPKSLHIQSTQANPEVFTGVAYYNGQYYILYSVNQNFGNTYYCYEKSNTIDGLSITYSNRTTTPGRQNAYLYGCQIGRFIVFNASNYVYYFDMSSETITMFPVTANTNNSIYFNERYFCIYSYDSNNVYSLIVDFDNSPTIIFQDTEPEESAKLSSFFVYIYNEYLDSNMSTYFSTPTLPEVSVNNAYAYVKVSSS